MVVGPSRIGIFITDSVDPAAAAMLLRFRMITATTSLTQWPPGVLAMLAVYRYLEGTHESPETVWPRACDTSNHALDVLLVR